jgi:hypothetical protein
MRKRDPPHSAASWREGVQQDFLNWWKKFSGGRGIYRTDSRQREGNLPDPSRSLVNLFPVDIEIWSNGLHQAR